MDFDPGELYEDGFDDGINEPDELIEEAEYDDDGNLVEIAAAAGFGYHMSQDELEERRLAEGILKRRDSKGKPVKVPLSHRHADRGIVTPFGRWATKANIDPGKSKDEIEYTLEEQLQIIRSEGE